MHLWMIWTIFILRLFKTLNHRRPKRRIPLRLFFLGLMMRHNIIMLTLCCCNHNTKALLCLIKWWMRARSSPISYASKRWSPQLFHSPRRTWDPYGGATLNEERGDSIAFVCVFSVPALPRSTTSSSSTLLNHFIYFVVIFELNETIEFVFHIVEQFYICWTCINNLVCFMLNSL